MNKNLMSALVFIILISCLSSFLDLMPGLLFSICLSSSRLIVKLVPMLKLDHDTNILLL